MDDKKAPYSAIIAAARDLLDRTKLSATTKIEHSASESLIDAAVGLVRVERGPRPDDEPGQQPRVIEGRVVDRDAEPEPIEYKPGRPSIHDPLPAPASDATLNGPGRAGHSFEELYGD